VDYGKQGVEVVYFNVQKDAEAMRRFVELSGGDRRVPLIERNGKVTVGFNGS
jgi:glutaredoxin 3